MGGWQGLAQVGVLSWLLDWLPHLGSGTSWDGSVGRRSFSHRNPLLLPRSSRDLRRGR